MSKIKATTEMLRNYVNNIDPIELKKLHIKQAKQMLKTDPELADKIKPILEKLQNELAELKEEAKKKWPFPE